MKPTRCLELLFALGFASLVQWAGASATHAGSPPSPYVILESRLLAPPTLEAIPICLPLRLSDQLGDFAKLVLKAEWKAALHWLDSYLELPEVEDPEARDADVAYARAVIAARTATERRERVDAVRTLDVMARSDTRSDRHGCVLLESARLYILLRRFPEATAMVSRANSQLSWLGEGHPLLEAADFYLAEIRYYTRDEFNAHLAYRGLTESKNPRTAAAARLRLTDLSFDAGKSGTVQIEYEALLPHGKAFGAKMHLWSLRAAEAALDSGDYAAATAWLKRFTDGTEDRYARDVVTIRQADLDVLLGRPDDARARLRALFGRKGDESIDVLARVRQVDLGVSPQSPDDRVASVRAATSCPARGVRIYALSVLVHELLLQGRLDEGIAAATRLAYEGDYPVLTQGFHADLQELLDRSRSEAVDEAGCVKIVRRLGGRYGILLDRVSDPTPFLALGGCLEKLELHTLAVELYRSLARSYGTKITDRVALPLARSALASGDLSLARAAAEVNIRHGGKYVDAWRALLAEAEVFLEHPDTGRKILRELLERKAVPEQSVRLSLIFAQVLQRFSYSKSDWKLVETTLASVSDARRSASAPDFAEASMYAAIALRRAGERRRSAVQYARVVEFLPSGARRSEALFWLENLTGKMSVSESPQTDQREDVWAALGEFDQKLGDLAQRQGLGQP